MKFQNPSLKFFFEQTDGPTDGQAETNMLPTFFKVGRIKIGDIVDPIITLWKLTVVMETRVLHRSAPKPNAAFPITQ